MYVVYDTVTTLIYNHKGVPDHNKVHNSTKAAFACRTRAMNSGKLDAETRLAVTFADKFYAEIEKTVTRKNAMTGVSFEEPINTPYSCSAASESYFCS